MDRILRLSANGLAALGQPSTQPTDGPVPDSAEQHGRAGVPMEVMGLMLGEFVDDYTVTVVDVFAMPQSGTGISVEAVDPVFQAKMLDMLKQTGRPEMVVGWYHSHPGFGCWLSGVDMNTQQSFEALSDRAVAVVVDPIQSVKGKVVIDAFRLINPNLLITNQEPRQTTSNVGHLNKPSIQALIHGLNRQYYSLPINYRKNQWETKMLMDLNKNTWKDGLSLADYDTHCTTNHKTLTGMLDLIKAYHKSLEEEEKMTPEQLVIKNVGRMDPKRHLGENVEGLMTSNIAQYSSTRKWSFGLRDYKEFGLFVYRFLFTPPYTFPSISSTGKNYSRRFWMDFQAVLKTFKSAFSDDFPQPDVKRPSESTLADCLPEDLIRALLPFQREGVSLGLARSGRILLADDMGLGKTVQSLALAAVYRADWPLLIVAPSSVRFAWREQCLHWLGGPLRLGSNNILVVTSGRDLDGINQYTNRAVMVISYDLMTKHVEQLRSCHFGTVIMDESHFLKNSKAARTKAALPLLKVSPHLLVKSLLTSNSSTRKWSFGLRDYKEFVRQAKTIPGVVLDGLPSAVLKTFKSAFSDDFPQPDVKRPSESTLADCLPEDLIRALLPFQREGVSGTPAVSRPAELYPQICGIAPNLFSGGFHEFGLRYCSAKECPWGWDYTGCSNMSELQLILEESIMIRRIKADVLNQLPPKRRELILLDPNMIKAGRLKRHAKAMTIIDLSSDAKRAAMLQYFHETASVKLPALQ
ncbi:hypothetical protein AHF37_07706 [Paragonimus kellicotti]|nr:hypothetical protein AHF37_07706 [Paragonimus kellicotti]